MTQALTTPWNPQGAGCQLGYLTRGEDDKIWFGEYDDPNTKSQWVQSMDPITWHINAIMIYPYTNSGAGKTQNADVSRTPDFMGKAWNLTSWPGLQPNYEQGVKRSRYINARGLGQIAGLSIKVGSQPMFEGDALRMLVILDMLGLTKHYKEAIGLHYSVDSLVADSQKPSITITPWVGFPFQKHVQQYLNVGTFAAHKLTACFISQPLNKLIVNEVIAKGRGAFYLPRNIATGDLVTADDIQTIMAAECFWVTKKERAAITGGYREVFYKEWRTIGTQNFNGGNKPTPCSFDVDMKGLVHQAFLIVQKQEDVDALNWTKCGDDDNDDLIENVMLITGDKAREDGLPAKFYRTIRPSEAFKTKLNRHIYCIFNADTNPLSDTQITGGQNFTDITKVKINFTLKAGTGAVVATAFDVEENAFYTEKTSGFRVSLLHPTPTNLDRSGVKRLDHLWNNQPFFFVQNNKRELDPSESCFPFDPQTNTFSTSALFDPRLA